MSPVWWCSPRGRAGSLLLKREFLIAQTNPATFAKRAREIEKKRKAEEKREKRAQRKEAAARRSSPVP